MTRLMMAACAVLLFVIALAACAENPNEHVQSNQFFRPASPLEDQQPSAAAAQEQGDQGEAEAQEQDARESRTSESEQQQTGSSDDSATQSEDEAAQQSQQSQQTQQADQDQQEGAPLQTAEDVIRRYTNPKYGYSIELICSPFCSPTSNAIDRVNFGSETGRALVGVDVHDDDSSESEALLRTLLNLNDNVEFSSIEPTTTVTGEAAERFDWEEDRRATGGFQVRWHAVLVRVHGLAIVIRAGAVLEDYEAVSDALERAIDSFFLPIEITARPGRYQRFDFVLDYDTADFAQEFGQPTSNPPNEQAGVFVLQSTTALKAVLTWQILGEAFYDGDTAITQSLRDSLGIENVSGFQDADPVDGSPARSGETETRFGEGVMMIQSYAWYCADSGREFVLHVLDANDPESVALPLIDGFRCSAEAESEE